MSPLLRSEILGLFVSTLNPKDNYSRHFRKNFAQPIEIILSKKPKIFSSNFIPFLIFT